MSERWNPCWQGHANGQGHGHAAFQPDCPLCLRCRDDPQYAQFRGERTLAVAGSGPARKDLIPLPCVHEGPVVEACLGCNGEGRHVRQCLHPAPSDPDRDTCTRVFVSAKVQSCDRCPDRDPPVPKSFAERKVMVGRVPAVSLSPTSPRAVVTVATGKAGEQLLAVSGPLMREYARRLGADFVVLDWAGPAGWPMGAKFQIPETLDHYDEVVYLDADVIVRPGCLDLFALRSDPGCVAAYNDLPEILGHHPKFMTEFRQFRKAVGLVAAAPIPYYLNTGLMVLSRQHRAAMTTPAVPFPATHCAEQHWWNSRLHDTNTPVQLLPAAANWQWWAHKSFSGRNEPPADAVLHFAGWDGTPAGRVAEMKKWTG